MIIVVAYTTSKPAQNQIKRAFGSAPFIDAKKVSTPAQTPVQVASTDETPIVPPLTVTDITENK